MRTLFPTTTTYLTSALVVAGVAFLTLAWDQYWSALGEPVEQGELCQESPLDVLEDPPPEELQDEALQEPVEDTIEEPETDSGEEPKEAPIDDHETAYLELESPEPLGAKITDASPNEAIRTPKRYEQGLLEPRRAEPVATTASTPLPENPYLHEAPGPVAPSRPPNATDQPSVNLHAVLPSEAADIYEELLLEGEQLRADGVIGPAYDAYIPASLIEQLSGSGLAKLVVVSDRSMPKTVFFFSAGDPNDPGVPSIAVDLRVFSERYIALSLSDGTAMVDRVRRQFHQPGPFIPGVLVRRDLDAVVLAAQKRTAGTHGLNLDRVARTSGYFCITRGLPFAYRVSSLLTTDGKRIETDSAHRAAR